MQEMWVQSLGGEDPLEREMATRFSILAWEIPWTEEPGGLQSMGSLESDTTKQPNHHSACLPNQTKDSVSAKIMSAFVYFLFLKFRTEFGMQMMLN